MKLLQTAIFGIGLAFAMSASADVTISGADLNNLHYSGDPGDAQFVAGTPDVAQLTTPDAGTSGDAPAVFVRASNGLATSSLSNLSALNASYSLSSLSGGAGNQPYFLTYLTDPNTSGLIGVVSFSGPDLNGSSQIHVFYDNDPGALSSDTYWGDSLSTLEGTAYGSTTFGQLSVYETGVEIGDWAIDGSIGATANIQSITISSVPEPSTVAAGVAAALSLGFSAMRRVRARSRKA